MTKLFNALFVVLVCICMMSCYSAKKAAEQVNRAAARYPDTTAKILRGKWPCIIGTPDSSIFKPWLKRVDSLLNIIDTIGSSEDSDSKAVIRNYRAEIERLKEDSSISCAEENEILFRSNAELQGLHDRHIEEKALLKGAIAKLKEELKNAKAIKEPIRDSAETYLLQRELGQLRLDIAVKDAKISEQGADIKEFKSDKRKPLTVLKWFGIALASQWWFWLIIVGLTLWKFRSPLLKLIGR